MQSPKMHKEVYALKFKYFSSRIAHMHKRVDSKESFRNERGNFACGTFYSFYGKAGDDSEQKMDPSFPFPIQNQRNEENVNQQKTKDLNTTKIQTECAPIPPQQMWLSCPHEINPNQIMASKQLLWIHTK